jgi:hypothetical protein
MQKLLAQAEEAATNAKYAPLESQAKLQQIYAQIDNITADNARADAEFKRKIDKDDNLNAMYQGMMASGDPAKWLEDYKDGLTPDEYKALSEVITKSATDKQKVAETERAAKNTDTLDSLKNKMLASGDKYEDYMAYVKRYGGYISPENIAELVKIASAFKPEKSSGVTYVPNNN